MEPRPRTIGKYEIVATLGKGSMGVVFKARDPLIDRFVAIKIIRTEADGLEEQEIKQRFRREAQAAGRMHHANIVSVYEYGEDENGAFIAMEFIEGKTLAQALAEGRRFDLEEIVNIMSSLLSALDYSHRLAVIHRDIKPANIMLTAEGEVKVADFGIAGLESSTLTRTGMMMGTPSHMAPEQLLGQRADARADVFSAGGVLYQLLTGQRPFHGTLASVMHQVAWVDPEMPSARNPEVPPAFDAVVAKAMAKRPEDRYQSAVAFRDAIRAVFRGLDETRRHSISATSGAKAQAATATPAVDAPSNASAPASVSPRAASDPTIPLIQPPRRDGSKRARGGRRWTLIGGIAAGLVAIGVALGVLKPQGQESARPEAKPQAEAARAPAVAEVKVERGDSAAQDDKLAAPRRAPGVATRSPGEVFADCAACPEVIVIAPGQFTTVSAPADRIGKAADRSRQSVAIAHPFAMGRYEVTRSQFAVFVAETGHQGKGCWTYDGQWVYREDLDWRSPGFEQQDQHPVTCVSWLDAQAFVSWLRKKTGQAYRLPSSSEWKLASGVDRETAGEGPNQREVCRLANVADRTAEQQYAGWTVHPCRDGYVHTAPVGRFLPNGRGVHDMLGNVFEWVEDCWTQSLQGASDGSAVLAGDCEQRVLHGGSWFTIPRYVDPEFRNRFQTSHRASSIGFRVVRAVAG